MAVARGNGGKTPILFSSLGGGDPVFAQFQVVGANFAADLVTDPTDPTQAAAAIGSDLEVLTEFMSDYGTILGIAIDSNYCEIMYGHNCHFRGDDAQAVLTAAVADLLSETGLNATVIVSRSIRAYQFATPS